MQLVLQQSARLWDKVNASPRLFSFLFGAMTALGYAPFNFFPAAIIAFSAFLVLMENEDLRAKPVLYGWLFGYGHFLFSLYWIGNAPPKIGLWYITPVVWTLMFGILAFYGSFVIWGVERFARTNLSRVFLFALLWSLGEYARYHINGLPWDLNGYVWGIEVLQITSVIGIYGLSALTTLLFVCLASRSKVLVTLVVSGFVGLWGWGSYRLKTYPTELTGVNMRLVQPSIPQDLKWQMDHFQENLVKQLALSTLEAERPLKVIIWPEASIPAYFMDYPPILEALREITPEKGYIIVGGPRHEGDPKAPNSKIFTSSYSLDGKSKILSISDKSHLVPFGEYAPLKSILPIKKLTAGSKDYTAGNGLVVAYAPGVPTFTTLICFEAIFPGQVIPTERPLWLLNQTNDAWYGNSTGPYQHLQIVRVRAIEEGLPMVRVANNGISAVIDSYGRILSRLNYDEVGFIDFELPKAINSGTVFEVFRDKIYYSILSLYLICCLIFLRNKRVRTGARKSTQSRNRA